MASELNPGLPFVPDAELAQSAERQALQAAEAIAAVREGRRKFDGATFDAVERIAALDVRDGRIDKAKALRLETLEWSADQPELLVMCAVNASKLFLDHEAPAEALRIVQKTRERLAMAPGVLDAEHLAALGWTEGWAHLRLGHTDLAIRLLEEHKGDGAFYLDVLSSAHAKSGDHRKAYDYLRKYTSRTEHADDQGKEALVQEFRERSEREAELKVAHQLAENSRRLWLGWGGAVLLSTLVVAAALFWRTRVAQRTAAAMARMNEQLHELASRDALTGLHNRGHFAATVETHVAAARRAASAGASGLDLLFFLIDLDHFKKVNDVHGHGAGDTVLKEAALRLQATVRAEDMLVRWGGEEFLIMTRGTPREQAPLVAERIRVALARAPMTVGPTLSLRQTCSIGFAPFPLVTKPDSSTDWASVVELADQALYRSKEQGRNGWTGIVQSDVDFPEGVPAGALSDAVLGQRCELAQGRGVTPSPESDDVPVGFQPDAISLGAA